MWEVCLNSAEVAYYRKKHFLIKSNHPTTMAVMCLVTLCDADERGSLLITFHMEPDRLFSLRYLLHVAGKWLKT